MKINSQAGNEKFQRKSKLFSIVVTMKILLTQHSQYVLEMKANQGKAGVKKNEEHEHDKFGNVLTFKKNLSWTLGYLRPLTYWFQIFVPFHF